MMDLPSGLYGPDGVVLMGHGETEQTQHFIPDNALNVTVVGFDDPNTVADNGCHEGIDVFGIKSIHQACITGQIGKKNGRVAALALRYEVGFLDFGIAGLLGGR